MLFSDCPSSVTVSPSGLLKAGDVLTCMSDGYPEPSYSWTDNDGMVIFTGPSITLTDSYSKLTCTATGNFTTPCTASKTVQNKTMGRPTWNMHFYYF